MNRTLRCVATVSLALLVGAPLMSSCAQEAEGERCELDKGLSGADSDCADGLSCTDAATLQHSPAASVCCPTDKTFTTIVCTPKQAGTTTTSSTSTGSGGGMTSGGGGTASGTGGTGGAMTAGGGGTATATGAGGAGGAGGAA